jgi:D-sedoheptulose 7-phosphate isomerase
VKISQNLEAFLTQSIETKQKIISDQKIKDSIVELALTALETLQNGNKIIFCGNGGSFADAQHLAAEFVSRFMIDRGPLPALALGTNASNLSAIANDYGYEYVFARELRVIAQAGDLFIPISTSGKSHNVLEAVKVACEKGLKCFALSGGSESPLAKQTHCISVPSNITAHIQESHITIGHFVCKFVEEQYF